MTNKEILEFSLIEYARIFKEARNQFYKDKNPKYLEIQFNVFQEMINIQKLLSYELEQLNNDVKKLTIE